MINLGKLLLIACSFYSLNAFGQIKKIQDTYHFKQNWEIKKDYTFAGTIFLENLKKNKKIPLFSMQAGYKIHPLSYKDNLLTAKTENLTTKKHQTIKIDVSKGTVISGKTPPTFTLIHSLWPKKPIKVGEKWTQNIQDLGHHGKFFEEKSITWTYLFKEIAQFQKIPCAKIEVKINDGLKTQLKGSGVAWIDLKDGLIKQFNIDFINTLLKPSSDGVTKHLMKVSINQTK